jgi:hypothetical protein
VSVSHGRAVRTGDMVIALRDGDRDPSTHLPRVIPRKGGVYRVTDIYPMWYGLGCQLEGMDPSPFRGYILWRRARSLDRVRGRSYFRRIEADDELLQKLFAAQGPADRKRLLLPPVPGKVTVGEWEEVEG